MLEVQIENIVPVTEARDRFNQILDAVEGTDELYVFTKNGKPAGILVGVHHLEKLTGVNHEEVFGGEEKNDTPVETPIPESPNVPSAAAPAPAPQAAQAVNANTVSAQPATANQNPGITYDNNVSVAQAAPATTTDVDLNPPIDGQVPVDNGQAQTGQAIAPDAVIPAQTGPTTDPFAIPTEPLDLPEDNQIQPNNGNAQPPVRQAQ